MEPTSFGGGSHASVIKMAAKTSSLRIIVIGLLIALSAWLGSLVVASAYELDPRLGTAKVVCTSGSEACLEPEAYPFTVLWLPWPPITWYSFLAGIVGGLLGGYLARGTGRRKMDVGDQVDSHASA